MQASTLSGKFRDVVAYESQLCPQRERKNGDDADANKMQYERKDDD